MENVKKKQYNEFMFIFFITLRLIQYTNKF
jgi:hypothetical protein